MQVRDRTDAPPPQVREHTDQPLHVAHSFLKCSCLRVRAGCTDESSLLGPHAEIQEGWKKSIKQRETITKTALRTGNTNMRAGHREKTR